MKTRKNLRPAVWVLAICALVFAPVTLSAQAQDKSDDNAVLTLKDVKDRLKQNKKHLDEASKRGKAGDTAGMQKALENYERGTEGLDRALSKGRFSGTLEEREEAFDRVEKATRKHTEKLTELLDKVPEQARPAIAHAREVSQKGRTMAMQHLEQARAERKAAERSQSMRRPEGMGGRPGEAGPPTGMGHSGGRPGGGPPSGGQSHRPPRP